MSFDFDHTNATPWTGTPGLYTVFNVDGQTALDEDHEAEPQVIHGWSVGIYLPMLYKTKSAYAGSTATRSMFPTSTSFGSWQTLVDKKWLLINKKTGHYLSARDDGGSLVPHNSDADTNSAHWRITLAEAGDLYKLYIYSVNFNGNCLTLESVNSTNGTRINCATRINRGTQNEVEKGQIWVVKKQN